MLPVRDDRNVWCHSSRLATAAVRKKAVADQERAQAAALVREVARKARKNNQLITPYPVTCPASRKAVLTQFTPDELTGPNSQRTTSDSMWPVF